MNLDQFQKQTQRQRSVPKLRFPGFSDPWERRKLGDVCEIKDSARIPNSEWSESGVPYIRASDITNENIDGVLFISQERYEFYKNRTGAPTKDDVLFNSGGEIGKSLLITDKKQIYVQGGAVLYARTSESKKLVGQYLKTYFETTNAMSYIDVASAGGTMRHFTLKPSQMMPVLIPSLNEQEKIGEYFSYLGCLITLHQRKLGILKQYKTGVEDSLFSKISTTKKIKDIIEILPKTNHPAGVGQSKGVYRFYTNNSTAQLYFNTYDYNAEAIVSNTGGDAHFEYHNGKFAASMHCMTFTSNINTKYLYYILSYFVNRINFEGFRGNGLKCLDKSWFANFDVTVPDIDKQNEIASILSEIDMLLEKETYILNRLKLLKQGLLQQMFT